MSNASWAALALMIPAPVSAVHAFDEPPGRAEIYADESVRNEPWHAGWADAVVSGDLVFISGVVAGLRENESEADLEQAFDRAFARIGQLLTKSGAGWGDVVEMTVYMTDVERQGPAFGKVRLSYMDPPYAASTVVQVSRLIPDRGVAEIKVVAHKQPRNVRSAPPQHQR